MDIVCGSMRIRCKCAGQYSFNKKDFSRVRFFSVIDAILVLCTQHLPFCWSVRNLAKIKNRQSTSSPSLMPNISSFQRFLHTKHLLLSLCSPLSLSPSPLSPFLPPPSLLYLMACRSWTALSKSLCCRAFSRAPNASTTLLISLTSFSEQSSNGGDGPRLTATTAS